MKTIVSSLLTLTFICWQQLCPTLNQRRKQSASTCSAFKFKDSSSAADVKKVEEAFAALPGKLPQIKGYEWGKNNSPENLNQGLTHCFILTFSSEKDRDEYLVHPDHKAFGKVLGPHLDKVTVVDFWTED